MRELQIEFISNPATARWMRILNLIEKTHEFTIVEISDLLNISKRTLIKDIQFFKEFFEDSAIFASNNQGFSFYTKDKVKYKEKKVTLLDDELLFEIMGNIFYGELDTIGELAHQYSCSESTLRRFLDKIRKPLERYGLTLSFNPVKIIGEEGSIRKFFIDFYYAGEQTPHTLHPPIALHKLVLKEVEDKIEYSELGTSATISYFYYTLYITLERVRQGHKIVIDHELKTVNFEENDFKLLYSLESALESIVGFKLPKEEFSWIHLVLLCNRTINNLSEEITFFERFNRWPQIETMTDSLLRQNSRYKTDIEKMTIPLKSYLLSRKINEIICPELNKLLVEEFNHVKLTDEKSFKSNLNFLKYYSDWYIAENKYLDEVAASLTIYLDLLYEYYSYSKRILFLLEGDPIVIQKIKSSANKYLHSHEVIFVRLIDLKKEYLNAKEVDLLITNYRSYISEYSLFENYVLIDAVPDYNDWNRIIKKLKDLQNNSI